MSFPVIKIELERMRATLLVALSEYAARMDSDIQTAVDQFCQPDNLKAVIEQVVERELKAAISQEVEQFFRYGAGRQAISRAVVERLTDRAKWMERDEE